MDSDQQKGKDKANQPSKASGQKGRKKHDGCSPKGAKEKKKGLQMYGHLVRESDECMLPNEPNLAFTLPYLM